MTRTCLILALFASAVARAGPPEIDYMLHCQGCHRADGAGTPGSVPAFEGSVARFLGVPGGREFLVRVPGSAQSGLDDAALAQLLNWIVNRFGPAADAAAAAPYTAAEVARFRHPPLVDVDGVRAGLVAAMADGDGADR
jgi:hypothetical protein